MGEPLSLVLTEAECLKSLNSKRKRWKMIIAELSTTRTFIRKFNAVVKDLKNGFIEATVLN
jgi:hypothetical protein